jgi:hypothetical protein
LAEPSRASPEIAAQLVSGHIGGVNDKAGMFEVSL